MLDLKIIEVGESDYTSPMILVEAPGSDPRSCIDYRRKRMVKLLKGCEEYAVLYFDDIVIYSHSWDSHLKHLETVLKRIEAANLTLKPSKCKFTQDYVLYLGQTAGLGSRRPSETKVQAVVDFVTPKTKTDIRAFLV
ncbi:Transposon Ty3-I Gag-Pol polyprotein like [Argiope bruennichi]|uniref:Transposon Ty3-I Gag-Pol polyprotein like n=1 Tax=Argiope bruennichi TaxID=94029 RepID=A0A8T0FV79_ARGBR|nr:Transposon Ty3-I Gag-Pol polyprotein like [Argiope bruennichi]